MASRIRLPILDGLRGFAAITVLFGHAFRKFWLMPWQAGLAQLGVLIFFMLSAFLLTYLYAGRPFNMVEIRRYAVHRIGRVVPLYYFITILSFLIGSSIVWTFYTSAWNAMVALAMISNNWSLWSIPVEMQFYAIFLILWYDISRGHFLRSAIVISAAMMVVGVLMVRGGLDVGFLPTVFQHFMVGVIAGVIVNRNPHLLTSLQQRHGWLGWAAAALFIASIPGIRVELGYPTPNNMVDPLVFAGCAALFFAALFGLGPMKIFATRLLRFYGDISYGVYIIHWVVMMNLVQYGFTGPPAFFLMVAISTLLGWLSYHLLELPTRRWINRFSTAQLVPPKPVIDDNDALGTR